MRPIIQMRENPRRGKSGEGSGRPCGPCRASATGGTSSRPLWRKPDGREAPGGSPASRDEMTMLMGMDPRMRANQRRMPNPDCGFGEEDLGCGHGSKPQRKKKGADPGMGKVGNGRHFQMVWEDVKPVLVLNGNEITNIKMGRKHEIGVISKFQTKRPHSSNGKSISAWEWEPPERSSSDSGQSGGRLGGSPCSVYNINVVKFGNAVNIPAIQIMRFLVIQANNNQPRRFQT